MFIFELGQASYKVALLFSLIVLMNYQTKSERVDRKIYTNLQSEHYCVRRLNLTHQVGCTSDPGGNIGVVWIINDESDIDHVLTYGPTPPYTVVMNKTKHFTSDYINRFKKSYPNRISGVILIKQNMTENENSDHTFFSTDATCPNRFSGLYANDTEYGDCKKQHWQRESVVTDLFFQDIPFPIFLMTKKETIDEIMNCFTKHNQGTTSKQSDSPLCSAQLDAFMLSASNSDYCLNGRATIDDIFQLQSSRCRPINKNNIFGYYKDSTGVKPAEIGHPLVANRSVVLISTRMDSMSFFKHLAPGADSAITGLVVLLAVSQALAQFKTEVKNNSRNIAFAIFDAESFDYTGSGRMAYDMKTNRLITYATNSAGKEVMNNINLYGVDYIIELNQLAPYPTDHKQYIYIHVDPQNYKKKKDKFDTVVPALLDNQTEFFWPHISMPLPPASIQSFLKEDRDIVALVLTNHEKEYKNMYYHSIFDDINNINRTINNGLVTHLTNIATRVARGAFKIAFGEDKESIVADRNIVQQLLECYLISSECDLIKASSKHSRGQMFKGPVDTYDNTVNSMISQLLLSYFLSDKIPQMSEKECDESHSPTHRYIYINGKKGDGICTKSQVIRTPSLSPAFQYEDVSYEQFSTWTESETNIRNPVRLFIRPSPSQEWITFISGLSLTIFSFVIVSCVQKLVLKQHQSSSA